MKGSIIRKIGKLFMVIGTIVAGGFLVLVGIKKRTKEQ